MSFLSYLNPYRLSTLVSRKFSIIDVVVLVSYYIFSLLLFLSLTGLFKKELIIIGLVVGFLFFLVFFWKKIEFKKYYLYFFILIPIILVGFLLIKGYFAGMGMSYWLPWAREIVLQGEMINYIEYLGRMPLAPLFYAGSFSLFGLGNLAIAFLPFFFAAATCFLIYQWLLEKGVKKGYIIFGILLLLTNPLFLDVGIHPMQEPFILFFAAAFFYYLEKAQRTNNRSDFIFVILTAVLASVSKMTGFMLFLPLLILFIKKKLYRSKYFYSLFLAVPLFIWLLRNYILYDNPLFPFLTSIFGGRYSDLVAAVNKSAMPLHSLWTGNILEKVAELPVVLIFSFFPLLILSFYGFWKQRKILYIFLFLFSASFFMFLEPAMGDGFIRYSIPFLALFIIYALVGLQEMKSRILLAVVFFISLWGLFSTELAKSTSQFIAPAEGLMNAFRSLSQLVYDYGLFLALALGFLFLLLISQHKRLAKYLILLLGCCYLIKTKSLYLGSWLNIWMPILGLVFIILAWWLIIKFKREWLLRLSVLYIIVLLVFSGWGMATLYFVTHDGFVFPNIAEAYGSKVDMAAKIQELEGENRDFRIYTSSHIAYFVWYYNFETVKHTYWTFHQETDLKYNDDLDAAEIHSLFKKGKIKYVVHRNGAMPEIKQLFDKIKSRPDLFQLLFEDRGTYLWKLDYEK